MPIPKIEKAEQITVGGEPARKLVKVVKVSKDDPSVASRLVELVAKAKESGGS